MYEGRQSGDWRSQERQGREPQRRRVRRERQRLVRDVAEIVASWGAASSAPTEHLSSGIRWGEQPGVSSYGGLGGARKPLGGGCDQGASAAAGAGFG
jgi:hypothetical protein